MHALTVSGNINMKAIRYTVTIIIIIFLIACEKDKQVFNSLIVGEWKLIEFYGVKNDQTLGWKTISDSPIQTIEFSSNEEYTLAADGNIICTGNYFFESDSTISLNPNDCFPRERSLETIFKLTSDTLILSNKSMSFLSSRLRKDKYIKTD